MPLSQILLIATVAVFGLSVFLIVRMLYPENFVEQVRDQMAEQENNPQLMGYNQRKPPTATRAFGIALLAKIGDLNEPLVRPAWRTKMRRNFIKIGRPEMRAQDFLAQQMLYALMFGLLGMMIFNAIKKPLWFSVFFGVFGFYFPYIWLSDQIKRRHKAILRAMPYHFDLLTLAVEAGLDFAQAMGKVVDKGQQGPLLEELGIVLNEIKFGKTRAEALRHLADRVELQDLSNFVANIIQADKMGTSIAKVLRIQSTQLRISRAQRAEKAANEAPVKMLFPLVLCFFPTIFIILFGPIIFRFYYGG